MFNAFGVSVVGVPDTDALSFEGEAMNRPQGD